jgi:serine/threonine protein kinase
VPDSDLVAIVQPQEMFMTMAAFEPGVRINDKYEILELIGAGAHGTVYRAIQHPVIRTVALKFISRHLSQDSDNRERFFHEARALARLNHPNVVTLFDYGECDGRLFMAMEYIEGQELTEIIEREKPMNPVRVNRLAQQILRALIEAHEMGLVHRDLKPANIMVYTSSSGEERIKVLDLGIASLREDTMGQTNHRPKALGTPGYCAPEQCLGRPVGPSADLYALGVMMFEMLSGKRPFDGPSAWMIIERHLNDSIPMLSRDLSVPPALESTVRLALAKRPEARFPDSRSMLTRLVEILANQQAEESYALPTLRELNVLDEEAIERVAARIVERRSQPNYTPPRPQTSDDTGDVSTMVESVEEPSESRPIGLAMTAPLDDLRPGNWEQPSVWLGITINSILLLCVGVMLSVFSSYS